MYYENIWFDLLNVFLFYNQLMFELETDYGKNSKQKLRFEYSTNLDCDCY